MSTQSMADVSPPPPADGSAHITPEPEHPQNGGAQAYGRSDTKAPCHPAVGELREKVKYQKQKLKQKSKPPGGFDSTPLPDAPPGYTVKFTFHGASNLPVGDLHLRSSDPFLHATLTAAVPRRHKEDPWLTRRTRTLRKTTDPVWEEDWVVANVPSSGFTLKCRLYDEDWPDHDDRLGNVTIRVAHVGENWEGLGPGGRVFEVRKRSGSKRAYMIKGVTSVLCGTGPITPTLHISIQVLGKSDPPHAQMYTVGPTTWVKHYSPMIGRLTGVKVNRDEENDGASSGENARRTQRYDFQANEIQLSGPVPARLYHRYVEFRPMIDRMFLSRGFRGHILHHLLHKQHNRIYNFDSSTEYGTFEPCSEAASLQFLRMAHFDEGGRIFTYVITLDGMMRFTETGKEFGIDLLSKHTMHSDVATYVACAGEFLIRRLARPVDHRHHHHHHHDQHHEKSPSPHQDRPNDTTTSPHTNDNCADLTGDDTPATHPPSSSLPNGPPSSPPPLTPSLYQLVIDNDSGTYRPDESVLPDLAAFLSRNFPGVDVVVMHCADGRLKEMKKAQEEAKRRERGGQVVRMVMNRSPSRGSSSSSSSNGGVGGSSDESRLGEMEEYWADVDAAAAPAARSQGRGNKNSQGEGGDGAGEGGGGAGAEGDEREGWKSKKEKVFDLVGEPGRWREVVGRGRKAKRKG